AGLELLLNGDIGIKNSEFLIRRHRLPTPRVEFAKGLAQVDRLALNDISDGIASEANELAKASGLTVYLDEQSLPVSEELKQFSRAKQLKYILDGGEDYELIGSVARSDWELVQK